MLEELKKELEKLTRAGTVGRLLSPSRIINGAIVETRGKQVVNFSNWDLLGVGENQRVRRAAQSALERAPLSAAASRLSTGTSAEIVAAENRLAGFLGAERALLLPSKNQGIFTLIAALLSDRDAVITDELTQAPVGDAAYLLQADFRTYRSSDPASLLSELERARMRARRLVFVEALSPITGHLADLKFISAQSNRFDAALVIDESFTLGGYGVRGAGGVEASALLPPFCVLGDLGHSFGLFGGFLAGSQVLISYIEQRSRALGIDTALPPALAAAVEAALDYIELAHLQREELFKRAKLVREQLVAAGILDLATHTSPILSLPFPKASKAAELTAALFNRGFMVEVVTAQVPFSEKSYVRAIITNRHTERQLEGFVNTVIELVPRVLRK